MIYKKPIVVAEIGCNHKGNFSIAKKMIKVAADAGATYAKFQKRDNAYLLKEDFYKLHPNPANSYGKNYGEHREFLEFSIKQHEKLFIECKKNKIKYATSVWEKKSAESIINSRMNLDYIKVPSACNLDFELLEILCEKFKKKIHLSLGMTTKKETKKIFDFFKKFKRQKDLILYSCTSTYPSEFKDICLLEISRLKKKYSKKIDNVSFSGHHKGIAIDISAYTLGAEFIERHFTLDRTWKGTDHAASLETDGLRKLIRDLNKVYEALKYKDNILKSESYQRKKLKRYVNLAKSRKL